MEPGRVIIAPIQKTPGSSCCPDGDRYLMINTVCLSSASGTGRWGGLRHACGPVTTNGFSCPTRKPCKLVHKANRSKAEFPDFSLCKLKRARNRVYMKRYDGHSAMRYLFNTSSSNWAAASQQQLRTCHSCKCIQDQ